MPKVEKTVAAAACGKRASAACGSKEPRVASRQTAPQQGRQPARSPGFCHARRDPIGHAGSIARGRLAGKILRYPKCAAARYGSDADGIQPSAENIRTMRRRGHQLLMHGCGAGADGDIFRQLRRRDLACRGDTRCQRRFARKLMAELSACRHGRGVALRRLLQAVVPCQRGQPRAAPRGIDLDEERAFRPGRPGRSGRLRSQRRASGNQETGGRSQAPRRHRPSPFRHICAGSVAIALAAVYRLRRLHARKRAIMRKWATWFS